MIPNHNDGHTVSLTAWIVNMRARSLLCLSCSPRDSTGCVWVSEQLCCMFALCSSILQHLLAAFRLCFRAQHSRTARVVRLWDFAVITESNATAASDNLWSAEQRSEALMLYLYLTSCHTESALCRIAHWALSPGKDRSLAYPLQRAPAYLSNDRVETQHSRSQWKHTHSLELKRVSSSMVPERRRTAHASGGI